MMAVNESLGQGTVQRRSGRTRYSAASNPAVCASIDPSHNRVRFDASVDQTEARNAEVKVLVEFRSPVSQQ
jgi:hypothetical protein